MDSTTTSIAASVASKAAAPASQSAAKVAPAGQGAPKVASDQRPSDASTSRTEGPSEPQRDPRSLQYQVEGDRVVTTVVDENNKTVVMQIPDAEVIRIAKAIDRMQGFLVEDKA